MRQFEMWEVHLDPSADGGRHLVLSWAVFFSLMALLVLWDLIATRGLG